MYSTETGPSSFDTTPSVTDGTTLPFHALLFTRAMSPVDENCSPSTKKLPKSASFRDRDASHVYGSTSMPGRPRHAKRTECQLRVVTLREAGTLSSAGGGGQ